MERVYQIIDRAVNQSSDPTGPIVLHVQPEVDERRFLTESLRIDEHTLNSSLDPDELSRVEFEPDHVALVYKRPRNYSSGDQLQFGVTSTGAFLFRDRLHVVLGDDTNLFDGTQRIRVDSLPGALLRLIGRSIVHFREHLRAIHAVSDELQAAISRSMDNKHLMSMFALEKSLVYYVSALHSNGALLDKLRHNATKVGFSPEELETLDDLIIDNAQCARQAEMSSNILASLMDARASVVANNINVLMKRLNVITIAIMVPTLVVSAFSMNVPVPWQDRAWMFYAVHFAAALSALVFLYAWRRLGG